MAPTSNAVDGGCATPRRTLSCSSRSSTRRSEQKSTAGTAARKRRSMPSHMMTFPGSLGPAKADEPFLERRHAVAATRLARHVDVCQFVDRAVQARGRESLGGFDHVAHAPR